jgi:hypothetical protein
MASPRRSSGRKRIAAFVMAAAVSTGCATSLPPTTYGSGSTYRIAGTASSFWTPSAMSTMRRVLLRPTPSPS